MCKEAEAVSNMTTPYSSYSENDIDLSTLKGFFTVTEKVDSLVSSELKNCDIEPKGAVSFVVECKSRITTTDFYVVNTEHRNLLNCDTALQLNMISIL